MTASTGKSPPDSTPQDELVDLKAIVAHLATLVEAFRPPGTPTEAPATADEVAASDTAFRYRLLSALMGKGDATALTIVVSRTRHDGRAAPQAGGGNQRLHLDVARPEGVIRGSHLAFTAAGVAAGPFALDDDRIDADALEEAGVDVSQPLTDFVLRDGRYGPIVAVAPPLAAVAAQPVH